MRYYPASDIPVQARRLYCLSPIRVITDVAGKPSPLSPVVNPVTGRELDLSLSLLRSVSPVHLEYLSNMGVRATLTASLMRGGELWGLIACHHLSPKRACAPVRELLEAFTRDLATQIALEEQLHSARRTARFTAFRDRVADAMRNGTGIADLLAEPYVDDLLAAVGADGVALLRDHEVVTAGRTPDAHALRAIDRDLRALLPADGSELFSTECLSEQIPRARTLADTAAGLIYQPLAEEPKTKFIWLRGEQAREVSWGGDPRKSTTLDDRGRISPRKSFAAWKEVVKLRSKPWDAHALTCAKELSTLIDIELRRLAEQALRDREMQLRNMLDNSPALVTLKDLSGRYRLVNRRFEAFFDVKNADIVGKAPGEVLPREIADDFMLSDRRVIASKAPLMTEEAVQTSRGERILLSTRFPVFDRDGQAQALCRIAIDITERRQAEDALAIALAKYRTLFESLPIGIAVVDARGRVTETNPALERVLGATEAERLREDLAAPAWSKTDGAALPATESPLLRAVQDRQLLRDLELSLRADDGKTRWISVTAAPLPLDGLGAVTTYEDITLRKRAQAARAEQAALRESERRFRDIANELPVAVWMHDADGACSFVNKTALAFAGASEDRPTGDDWIDCLHPDDRRRYASAFRACREARRAFHDVARMRRADGAWRLLESFARPLLSPEGSFSGMVGMSIDITERKAADEALRESHDALEERSEQLERLTSQLTLAEQREREHLAKLLHDHMQQLLVGMAIAIERLRRHWEHDGTGAQTDAIISGMSDLVTQALETARGMVADLIPPILNESGLPDALRWLARNMNERHALRIELSLAESVSPARDDVRRVVYEAVREALFNVVKHAQCAAARITLSRSDDDALVIVIADEGIGFDTAILRNKPPQATGLGILSMRERLLLLNGTCDIESAPGSGTRVTLTAPLGAAAAIDFVRNVPATAAPRHAEPRTGTRSENTKILLVDDHAMIRQALSSMLDEESGLSVVGEAANGAQAVAMAEELRPDLILMDYSMPDMDGIETTARIKARWPDIQVIGLSMYEDADRAAAMINAGASAYVAKTAGSQDLLRAIRDSIRGSMAASEH
ncbi:MAG: PAS domain S-box protein [Thiohalocapsa sp.]|nr:PAS domain S-box protein [Thiohalocapsa sp.]